MKRGEIFSFMLFLALILVLIYSSWLFFNNLNYSLYPLSAPIALDKAVTSVPSAINESCNDFCSENGADSYHLKYDENSNSYLCSCLGAAKDILGNSSYRLDNISVYEDQQMEEELPKTNGFHWPKLPVTYYLTNQEECGDYEVNKIKRAFLEIENSTGGTVKFEKANNPADINITCFFLEGCYEKRVEIDEEKGLIYRYETICAHNRGLAKTITERKEIIGAEIYLYGLAGFSETTGSGMSGFFVGSCGHPTTEIHEILHTFGFGHKDDPKSIMYYAEDSIGYTIMDEGECLESEKEIDKDIVEKMIRVYG